MEKAGKPERARAHNEDTLVTGYKLVLIFTGMLMSYVSVLLNLRLDCLTALSEFSSSLSIKLSSPPPFLALHQTLTHYNKLLGSLARKGFLTPTIDQPDTLSSYFLTQAGLILTYGQVLKVLNTRLVYLFAVMLFEIGSLICGVAPSITVLILGRAIAGCGAAGIFVSVALGRPLKFVN